MTHVLVFLQPSCKASPRWQGTATPESEYEMVVACGRAECDPLPERPWKVPRSGHRGILRALGRTNRQFAGTPLKAGAKELPWHAPATPEPGWPKACEYQTSDWPWNTQPDKTSPRRSRARRLRGRRWSLTTMRVYAIRYGSVSRLRGRVCSASPPAAPPSKRSIAGTLT
jgi:hypothetical protein